MIEGLTSQVKDRLKAVVLFGYNKNQQNQGKVPGFPDEKLKVICNEGDLVCNGTLIITPHHLTYQQRLGEAVEFIKDRVVLPVN